MKLRKTMLKKKPGGAKNVFSGTLFWKIYLHALLLLVLVAIAIGVTGVFLGRAPVWVKHSERLAVYLGNRHEVLSNREILTAELEHLRELFDLDASVYLPNGNLLVTNIKDVSARPPQLLEEHDPTSTRAKWITVGKRRALEIPIISKSEPVAFILTGGNLIGEHLLRAGGVLALIFVVLALGSVPFARAVTAPVQRLTEVARRLGQGDLSARSQIERNDEVGTLASAFDEMADRLDKLIRGEKELIANVSHELRTPLARIRVALELAAEGDTEKARLYMAEMVQDLSELEKLIDDVLTMARLDLIGGNHGALPLKSAPISCGSLVERIASRFRELNPERALVLEIEPDGTKLPEIMADEIMLRRAIDILLDNSRKYSDKKCTISLIARAARDRITGLQEGIELEVRDHGIGIDVADLQHLFRPFFRGEKSRARGTGGVGMGLALAKRIVEAHGGQISAESTLGVGTTVRLWLPTAGSPALRQCCVNVS